MKQAVSLLLAVCTALLLTACSLGTLPAPDGVNKVASYSGKDPLPLHVVASGDLWYMMLGTYGQSGGSLAVGADPEAPETLYEIPKESRVASFTASGNLAVWTERSDSRLRLMRYCHESGTVSLLDEFKADQCPHIALMGDTVYCLDAQASLLMRYDASGKASAVFPIASGTVQAMKQSGEHLAWVIATEQARVLFVCRPEHDRAPVAYTLPSHISIVYGFDFIQKTGAYVLAYADAITNGDSVGLWHLNQEEVTPYFNFSAQIRFEGSEITIKDGKFYWVTAAELSGRQTPHYRVIAMDLATHEPTEYMRAFSFSFQEEVLIYLGFDSNNRTDRVSLYQVSFASQAESN